MRTVYLLLFPVHHKLLPLVAPFQFRVPTGIRPRRTHQRNPLVLLTPHQYGRINVGRIDEMLLRQEGSVLEGLWNGGSTVDVI